MVIQMMARVPMPAETTTAVAIVIITARKVSERVVEKQEPINDDIPIRTRCRRANNRGRGFDHDRAACVWTLSGVASDENSTSTAATAAVLAG